MMPYNATRDSALDRFIVDVELVKDIQGKFLRGRHNILSTAISPQELEILRAGFDMRAPSLPQRGDDLAYSSAMARMTAAAKQAYSSNGIGSWSYGALLAFCKLGEVLSHDGDQQRRLFALVRWSSQVLSAQLHATEMTLWSLVGLFARWMLDHTRADSISSYLDSQSQVHKQLVSRTQNVASMSDWFKCIQDVIPVADSILGFYCAIDAMVRQGDIIASRPEAIPGWTLNKESEMNRLDEFVTYVGSHAISYYLDVGEHACADYILGLRRLAAQSGTRVAKRQSTYDVARLWIPRFLAEEACRAVDRQSDTHWTDALATSTLGQESTAIFAAHGTIQRQAEQSSISTEEEFIKEFSEGAAAYMGERLRMRSDHRGLFMSAASGAPQILISPTLSGAATRGAVGRGAVHLLREQGLLLHAVPYSATIEYLLEFWRDGKISVDESEVPIEFLVPYKAGRYHCRHNLQKTLDMLQKVMDRYRTEPKEDGMSFFWAAVLTGVVLELFGQSQQIALRYVIQLSRGESHESAIAIAEDAKPFPA